MREKTINVDGIKTSYTDEGSGDAVLFVHGLAGYKENWEENVPVFAERYRTIALDLPGFGYSAKPDVPYGIPFFAEFVTKFLRALGIERAHLVGNSMGGHTSTLIAAKYGSFVDKLVLADPTGARGKELYEAAPIKPEMIEMMGPVNPGEDFVRMYAMLQFFDPAPFIDKMVKRAMADLELGDIPERFNAYIKSLKGLFAHDAEPLYKDIQAPTLVIWGENDNVVPVGNADVAESMIPGARKIIFPQCGHLPMIEKSGDFNRAVLEFLG